MLNLLNVNLPKTKWDYALKSPRFIISMKLISENFYYALKMQIGRSQPQFLYQQKNTEISVLGDPCQLSQPAVTHVKWGK